MTVFDSDREIVVTFSRFYFTSLHQVNVSVDVPVKTTPPVFKP